MKLLWLILILLIADASVVQAQLFGQRTLGRPLSREPRRAASMPEVNADTGPVTGSERFIRGNRDRTSFVGADQGETQSFVGSQQGSTSGVIVSSTAGIEPPSDRSDEINQEIKAPTSKKMYLPKIVLSSDFISTSSQTAENRFTDQLGRTVKLASKQPIEVSVVDGSAILRGVVSSAKEKRLAETLALFEPGIWMVENQLQVQSSPPRTAPLPGLRTMELPPPDQSTENSARVP